MVEAWVIPRRDRSGWVHSCSTASVMQLPHTPMPHSSQQLKFWDFTLRRNAL